VQLTSSRMASSAGAAADVARTPGLSAAGEGGICPGPENGFALGGKLSSLSLSILPTRSVQGVKEVAGQGGND
jgi:hypothetical protein